MPERKARSAAGFVISFAAPLEFRPPAEWARQIVAPPSGAKYGARIDIIQHLFQPIRREAHVCVRADEDIACGQRCTQPAGLCNAESRFVTDDFELAGCSNSTGSCAAVIDDDDFAGIRRAGLEQAVDGGS